MERGSPALQPSIADTSSHALNVAGSVRSRHAPQFAHACPPREKRTSLPVYHGMNNKPATARDLIGDYLVEQCTVIIDSEAQLRAGEDVIHTTRVAVRRLRSTIRVFAELFDTSEAAHLEEELVWWADLLGGVRDMDILAQRQTALLEELPAELTLGPVASTIQTELAVQRKQAMDAMLEALDSERYAGIVIHPLSEGLRAWADLYQRVHRSSVGEPDAGRGAGDQGGSGGWGDR